MGKPTVHVILPNLAKGSPEAAVANRALESFRLQMHPFEVVVNSNDSDYEKAKNPAWMQEVPIYAQTERTFGTGPSVVEQLLDRTP